MTVVRLDTLPPTAAAVGAHGLPGSELDPPGEPLAPADWERLIEVVRSERLSGLLAAAVTAGAWPVTDDQHADVVDAHVESMAAALLLERLVIDVSDALTESSIPFRVLKGTAHAHLDFPDPALRPFGDVDLLVRPEALPAVMARLEQLGLTPVSPQVRPDFAQRFGKSLVLRTSGGLELDLHRTLVPGAYGFRIPIEDLWSAERTFGVGGSTLAALGDEQRLLHAAYHSVIGGRARRLMALRDLAEMALYGRFEQARLRELAQRWGCEPVLASAVRDAWSTYRICDVTALSRWADRYEIPHRERRLLALHATPEVSYAAQALSAVASVPGMRSKAAFVTSLALPDRAFLQERGTTRSAWLARGIRRSVAAARQVFGPT